MSYDHLIDAVESRTTGVLDAVTDAYVTDGGTYVIATPGGITDDHRPHDLVAVLPTPVEGSRVLVLRPTVNPDLVAALRQHLDPVTHRIVLDFENEQTLADALNHIGDEDAPVNITDGAVRTHGRTYPLWDGFNDAVFTTYETGA